jgi:hypothetical protein
VRAGSLVEPSATADALRFSHQPSIGWSRLELAESSANRGKAFGGRRGRVRGQVTFPQQKNHDHAEFRISIIYMT